MSVNSASSASAAEAASRREAAARTGGGRGRRMLLAAAVAAGWLGLAAVAVISAGGLVLQGLALALTAVPRAIVWFLFQPTPA